MSSILNDKFNPEIVDERISEIQKKDPEFAALLSLIIPGLGQFVMGSSLFGVLSVIAGAFVLGVARVNPDYAGILGLVYVILAVQSAYYTYKDVKSRNE